MSWHTEICPFCHCHTKTQNYQKHILYYSYNSYNQYDVGKSDSCTECTVSSVSYILLVPSFKVTEKATVLTSGWWFFDSNQSADADDILYYIHIYIKYIYNII